MADDGGHPRTDEHQSGGSGEERNQKGAGRRPPGRREAGGLHVDAALDTGDDPLGLAVTAGQLRALPIVAHAENGAWN